jgi:phosphate transport system substrate-binding protein
MTPQRRGGTVVALIAASVMLTSCAVNEPAPGQDVGGYSGIVVGGGSSAQQAAQEAWVAGFQSANDAATVEYDPAGSGAGRDMFIAGGSAFAGSDRAFTEEELDTKEFSGVRAGAARSSQLPAYIAPIVDRLPARRRRRAEPRPARRIARIFAGEIDRWNDEAIVRTEPGC